MAAVGRAPRLCFEEWLVILDFLPPCDVGRCAPASRLLERVSRSPELWRKVIAMALPMPHTPKFVRDWRAVYRSLRAVTTSRNLQPQLIARACDASSTDDATQNILCTLEDDGFWSSTGSDQRDAEEHLTYELRNPLSLVQSIAIRFYQAHWQPGAPIYPPSRVRFEFGFALDPTGALRSVSHTSAEFPVAHSNDLQRFRMPRLVPARYVRIRCLGKVQRQPGDELLYTVVDTLRVRGFAFHGGPEHSELAQCIVGGALWDAGFRKMVRMFADGPLTQAYPAGRQPHFPIWTGRFEQRFYPVPWASPTLAAIIAHHRTAFDNPSAPLPDDVIDRITRALTEMVIAAPGDGDQAPEENDHEPEEAEEEAEG